jgi:hypothetical protein
VRRGLDITEEDGLPRERSQAPLCPDEWDQFANFALRARDRNGLTSIEGRANAWRKLIEIQVRVSDMATPATPYRQRRRRAKD